MTTSKKGRGKERKLRALLASERCISRKAGAIVDSLGIESFSSGSKNYHLLDIISYTYDDSSFFIKHSLWQDKENCWHKETVVKYLGKEVFREDYYRKKFILGSWEEELNLLYQTIGLVRNK